MLTKQELKAYKDKDGYDLHQLELDYFQHVILSTLYRNHTNIFFKGGTCLQKVYGIKRFSEDLDFNYKDSIQAVEKTIQNIAGTPSDKNQTQYGTSFKTTFEGILYTGNPQSKCTVSYDFTKKRYVLRTTKTRYPPPIQRPLKIYTASITQKGDPRRKDTSRAHTRQTTGLVRHPRITSGTCSSRH